MSRLGRVAVIGAATMAAVTTLFTAPAQAATWLPTCNAPSGKLCVAVDNHTEKGTSKALHSFRALDGTCLRYKGDWGPGDVVGWPGVYVDAKATQLVDHAYYNADCGGKENFSLGAVVNGHFQYVQPYRNGSYLVQNVWTP